ncbi:MAG: MazG nucleotide pyrophosphohydrolase domain-containing protein [Limisphaerales bacterium]
MAKERGAFDFEKVTRTLVDKLVRRHPHVFGETKVKNVDEVWANWEKIKRAEKHGTKHARHSALDGIPKHLPALLRAEKLLKKARKANLLKNGSNSKSGFTKATLAKEIFTLTEFAQNKGLGARKELLAGETKRRGTTVAATGNKPIYQKNRR